MKRKGLRLILVAVLMLLSAPAAAQEFSQGVRSAGMGEAFTSVATGTSGIYHNPAGIARAVMYAVEGGFEYTPEGNILNASIVDSKTNPAVAAGVGYNYFFARGDSDIRGHDIRLGLGVPVIPDRVAIGVGGRWLIVKDKALVTDEMGDEVEEDVQIMNGPTLDAGIIFRATDQLHFGIAGQNLIEQCEKPECRHVAPTTVTGGASFGTETGLIVSADVGADLSSGEDVALNIGAGAEYLIAGQFPLRAGYERQGFFERDVLTFGAGWRSAAAGFDLGYQLDLTDTSRMYFLGSFSIYL